MTARPASASRSALLVLAALGACVDKGDDSGTAPADCTSLTLEPTSLRFDGDHSVGGYYTLSVDASPGCAEGGVTVGSAPVESTAVQLDEATPFALAPGETRSLTVGYLPADDAAFSVDIPFLAEDASLLATLPVEVAPL